MHTPHLVPLSVVTDLLDSCVAVLLDDGQGGIVVRPDHDRLLRPGVFLALRTPSRFWWFAAEDNQTVEVAADGFRLVDHQGETRTVMPLLAAKLPGAPGPLTMPSDAEVADAAREAHNHAG